MSKDNHKNRPCQIKFRMDEGEKATLDEKVQKSGKSRQDYLLACALEKPITNTDALKDVLLELVEQGTEMHRQGVNLNQIAAELNRRKFYDYGHLRKALETHAEMEKKWEDTWQSLRQRIRELD